MSWYHAPISGCPLCLDKIRHVLECSLNRMPKLMPPVAEKKKEGKKSNSSGKQEQNKGSRLLLLRADELTASSKHVLLERSFVKKKRKAPSPGHVSPITLHCCCWC
jgi:hypothetical protein